MLPSASIEKHLTKLSLPYVISPVLVVNRAKKEDFDLCPYIDPTYDN